ncbi:MAG: AAA family ATPase [Burkholderiales bacterium]
MSEQATATLPPAYTPLPAVVSVGAFTGFGRLNAVQLPGFDRPWVGNLMTPAKDPDFVWDEDFVHTMTVFWLQSTKRAIKLIGHTGTGKTEGVFQWHAALNLPLLVVMGNPRTEAVSMIGGMQLTPKGMQWVDGPVTKAARLGLSVLIDEYNLIDPGENSGLNALLEGKPYTVPETGETIVPQPGFRVFVTMNPKTTGYRGRQMQDMANDGRFAKLTTRYMLPEVETRLVKKSLSKLYGQTKNSPDEVALDQFAKNFVEVANAIRKQYMGVNDGAAALPCTMCTRTTLAMAEWTAMGRLLLPPNKSAMHWALDKVLASDQPAEVQEALHQILRTTTGEPEEISVSEV